MKVYIGSDHAGFELKKALVSFLAEEGHEVEDRGAYELNEGDDYPDFVMPVAHAVAGDPGSRGVVLGGSGQGEAIAANRVAGARAALYYGTGRTSGSDNPVSNGGAGGPLDIVRLSREHNDANILSLGARFVNEEDAKTAVRLFLGTPFGGEERHQRRIKKIDEAEEGMHTPGDAPSFNI